MGFKVERIRAGKKAAEVAEYMGVSVTAVSLWENGHTMPDIRRVKKLAEYYGCTVDELLSNCKGDE